MEEEIENDTTEKCWIEASKAIDNVKAELKRYPTAIVTPEKEAARKTPMQKKIHLYQHVQ